LQEIGDVVADDFLKTGADQVGETAVCGAKFAVKGDGDENIIEGIDEVAIALLRALDDAEQFVELIVAGRRGMTLLDAANQATEFRDS